MNRSLLAAVVALLAAPVAVAQTPPLRWGADVSGGGPYIFQTPDGAFTGFEWDFAAYLGKKLGRTPDLRKGDWDKLPQRLDLPADGAEGIDIVLNGYEFREDLSADYAPSRPYFAYRLALVVNADDDRIRGWSDLPGKSVGVLGGSAADDFLIRTYAGTIDRKVNPDVATVMGLVEGRRLDATVQDGPAATHYLRGSPKL
ncbi:MAG: substrate-binding periplasmic protein, partial [Fimbriiglobus sp.]